MSTPEGDGAAPLTVAGRLSGYLRGGGLLIPFVTALLAFLVGGLVVAATGANPIDTYRAIFDGTGLNWLLPWTSSDDRSIAAINLQQTLIATTPLIVTGLAVAFAFRCGLFNIGGQGQYLVGAYVAAWIGSSLPSMNGVLHVLLTLVLSCLAGALWGGISGVLKATTGASEVITTIMLNWIAVWVGFWLFGLGGPLQNDHQQSVPVSNDVVGSAHLPVFWGDAQLQGLHIGIFIALLALVVFWVLLNRTRLGFEVRAVGFNPEAARTAGISVARNYIVVMAVCGLFAGLGGALDVLGWEFRIATNDIQISQIGFLGIAVALLGRNTAVGTLFSALLFGALVTGTSVRNLDPSVFQPDLASNLTWMIQGLVVLLVSTDVLIAWLWTRRGRLRRRREKESGAPEQAPRAVQA
jgi:general nucleoside transport system permease protein